MTKARLRTGRIGEDLACRQLERDGLAIVARNCRTRFGEIDVIAIDGETLVFVEVKTIRAGGLRGPERPAHAVGRRKQMQVRRLARAWLAENLPPPLPLDPLRRGRGQSRRRRRLRRRAPPGSVLSQSLRRPT